ncbi:SatD family protein [Dyadobacter pollutisoli]|uniref:SatD family protein n=1 Tax=Dyadobacter pollutisoli TaxID=2910158 RepID=A0A9E8NEH5_9BACT|nr:SatD family protein [Dyadobacter pollutisoli]WAC13813.1 SatD family protein [Dyadobacter pollutisoli]
MKKSRYILMADIINSRKSDQKALMVSFERLVNDINSRHKRHLLSPLTITLGDEFQSVAKSLKSAIEIIFGIEERIIRDQYEFKLRYVLVEGEIDTPINPQIAYGMLGEGLTNARKALIEAKGNKGRFFVEINDTNLGKALNNSLAIYQSLTDNWKAGKDYPLIKDFLTFKDYKKVATETGKTRSQIWKREKSLKINEYIAIKEVIHYLIL